MDMLLKLMWFSAARFPYVAYIHKRTDENVLNMNELLPQNQYSNHTNLSLHMKIGLHRKWNGMYLLPLLMQPVGLNGPFQSFDVS